MRYRLPFPVWLLPALALFLFACEETGGEVEEVVGEAVASFEPSNPWPLFHDAIGFVLYYDRDFWERANTKHLPDGFRAVAMHSKNRHEVLRIVVEDVPEDVPLPAHMVEHIELLTGELPRFERLAEERVVIAGVEGRRLDYTFLEGEVTWRMSEYHFYVDDRYFILVLGAEENRWESFEPRSLAIAAGFRATEPRLEPAVW